MGTFLERILAEKQKEVLQYKETKPKPFIRKAKKYSFIDTLKTTSDLAFITEFKRASPSKGIINNLVKPEDQAAFYENYGAAAISVLTDQKFFLGSFSDLGTIRDKVNLPILCKDFIIDPIQIDLALANGADLILLIAAALEDRDLKSLYQYAIGQGLEVLLEVHNKEELERAIQTGANLIGVNNRDLKTFQVSLEVTEELAPIVKSHGSYLISESGISSLDDVERVRKAGANGILVGEALMKDPDLIKALNGASPLQKEGAME